MLLLMSMIILQTLIQYILDKVKIHPLLIMKSAMEMNMLNFKNCKELLQEFLFIIQLKIIIKKVLKI